MIKRISVSLAIVLLLSTCTSSGQVNLSGDWSGTLNMAGVSLRLIFHISESEGEYSASIESVDQGGAVIPAEIEVEGSSLTVTVEQLNVIYVASASGNQIIGEFSQFGNSMPDFTLTRNE